MEAQEIAQVPMHLTLVLHRYLQSCAVETAEIRQRSPAVSAPALHLSRGCGQRKIDEKGWGAIEVCLVVSCCCDSPPSCIQDRQSPFLGCMSSRRRRQISPLRAPVEPPPSARCALRLRAQNLPGCLLHLLRHDALPVLVCSRSAPSLRRSACSRASPIIGMQRRPALSNRRPPMQDIPGHCLRSDVSTERNIHASSRPAIDLSKF